MSKKVNMKGIPGGKSNANHEEKMNIAITDNVNNTNETINIGKDETVIIYKGQVTYLDSFLLMGKAYDTEEANVEPNKRNADMIALIDGTNNLNDLRHFANDLKLMSDHKIAEQYGFFKSMKD